MVLIDSYNESNLDTYWALYSGSTTVRGQSFECDTRGILDSVSFKVYKSGSPTGNVYVKIYEHSGTYGSTGLPTGSALATSDAVSASSLGTSGALKNFVFSGANRIELSSGYYIAVLEYSSGNSSNYVLIGSDASSSTHSGNAVSYDTDWLYNGYDNIFYVYREESTLVGFYSETNQDGGYYLYDNTFAPVESGQSFYNETGRYLESCKFYLKKVGTPTGNMSAKLYAHSGTFGTSSVATGSALATSGEIAATSLSTSYALVEFTFTGSNQVYLSPGTHYVIAVSHYGVDVDNCVVAGSDESSPTHAGNVCTYVNVMGEYSWSDTNSRDLIFYVYGTSGESKRSLYTIGGVTTGSERSVYTKSGGITYSERGIYTKSNTGESERSLYTEGKAMPVGIPFYAGEGEKKYSVKVFDRAGTTFKGSYDPIGGYSFNKVINGGVGDLTVNLPRKFDKYGLGDDVNLLDEIQIWVQDKDTSGKKIYSGYVSGITSYVDGSSQGITLDVLGYVSRLGFTLDWDGTNMSIARNSMTPGEIVKDVIDDYRTTVAEERINYGTSTVNITGTDVSYTSNAKSCLETIDRVREMAGATWYWYVDADNVFYFDAYSATPDHYFVFGKDISSLEIKRSADDIKNELVFWNGLQASDTNFLSTRYYHSSSITNYWNRFERLTDARITTGATADELGDSYINAYKDPNVSMKFEVKDNNLGEGYDIESIEPGHTCKILNLDDSDVVGDNMVITSVKYTPESAIVMVSDLREITGRSLTNLRRQLDSTVYGDRPADITSEEIT